MAKKKQKHWFIRLDSCGDGIDTSYTTFKELQEDAQGGDEFAEVVVVKRFKAIDESVKIVEVK